MVTENLASRNSLSALAERTVMIASIAIGLVLATAAILFASNIFLLVFAGVLLSIFLRRLAAAISSRTRIPYGLALALVVLGILGLAAGFGFLLAPSLASQVQDLRHELPQAFNKLRNRLENIDAIDKMIENLPSPQKLLAGRGDLWSRVTGVVSNALSVVTDGVVIVFVGLYVALAPKLYRRGLLALVPARHRDRATQVLADLDHTLWWWLLAKLIAMLIIGALTAIGLSILGVPAPIALGVIAAVLTFIPNFGPVISAVPAVLLALTQGVKQAGIVVALYIVIQAIESYLITPNIEKKAIDLPPALTISAQVLLGVLAGPLGLVVATPVCAATLALVRQFYVKSVS